MRCRYEHERCSGVQRTLMLPLRSRWLVQLDFCSKEFPRSAALPVEGADYIRYFCGAECYQK
ncbi:DUF3330 domain-containing protein [Methylosarcina fibrata]|uniref:DUF3330 domain-containing protein n=1 Tax=Methylosarcina fibrata TaxID=105972 RepID=UPI0038B9250F